MKIDDPNIKKKLEFIQFYKEASNAATGSKFDANANVACKNIATLQTELGKKDVIDLNRVITGQYIENLYGPELKEQYFKDLAHHIIYTHDESSLMPYCCSISLYPFLLSGLKELGGTSEPPKHANSFIGGVINLIFLVAGQFAGAVAIPEFLMYFDYFLRKDYGDDYIHHLDDFVEAIGGHKFTLRHKIEDWFQQFVFSINQPAGARNYQSPFTNIAYFDRYYFENIFEGFVFPDGGEPCWETTKELQKMFMKWFNAERLHSVLTFPVETANILVVDGKYKDEEMADFFAEMWSEGHSFFMYQSDSVDALASCCFGKDQKVIARSNNHGVSKIYYDTFENIGKTSDGPDRKQFDILHNGSWCKGTKIRLPNRKMFKVTTANNKEIIVSDNHLNPTLRGDIATNQLTVDDYLLFNIRPLNAVPEQDLHLTYEQGFAVGAFLGDGSFGSEIDGQIYDVHYSQNINKYAKCIEMVNKAVLQLGDSASCCLNQIYNNVYPIRISSRELVQFIIKWTNWQRGTYAHNKELNMDCLLQSYEFRKGILDGWYNTDGGNSNRCYTTSGKLIDCMEALITSLGLNSIINVSDRTDEKVVIRDMEYNRNYPLYCIRWYDTKNKRSMKDIYKTINNSVYFKIKSIEPYEYSDDIYCFEMDNQEEPYFTLPSGLITHNCRLRNAVEEHSFSFSLGAGAIETGSKRVCTLNINRIVQDWDRDGRKVSLKEYVAAIEWRVHKYLRAWNQKLWDDFNAGILTVYKAGFIDLDKQYLTSGINGFVEAAEYLGITIDPDCEEYKQLAKDVLGTIKEINEQDRDEHHRWNTEFVPAENLAAKNYKWDKEDGYVVPEGRNLYNSYFYIVEDTHIDPVKKFYYQGQGFATECDGGVALHNNLSEHLSKEQYRKLMDVAVDAGCNYFTFNIPGTRCTDCGHISKRFLKTCPKCGSKHLVWHTRIIGYLKEVSNFSEARQEEFGRRYFAKLGD